MSVICGRLELDDGEEDTAVNPSFVAEVLSDSTDGYDGGKKFENYRQIPSLRAYLLVSQREPHIEQFTRNPDGLWVLNEANGMGATLEVPALSIRLSLAEIYANVAFKKASEPVDPPRLEHP